MRKLIMILSLVLIPALAMAAEKSKTLMQLDSTRAAVEAAAIKAGENREALADIDQARNMLKKAQEVADKGKEFIVFGDLKAGAELELKNYLDMSDVLTASVLSRVEKARAATELEALDKQFTAVKAKLKVFEDRKAELEKLKADAAKCASATKELELAKAEKTLLATQIEQLTADKLKADKVKVELAEAGRKLDELKGDNARLTALSDKLQADNKKLSADLESARKAASHKEPAEQPAAPKEPAVKLPAPVQEVTPVK